MTLQVYKVNLTGYVIRNSDIMDDPNNLDLNTIIAMVLNNNHDCTIDLIDSTGDTGCDCTECTCGAKSTALMLNLEPTTTTFSYVSSQVLASNTSISTEQEVL